MNQEIKLPEPDTHCWDDDSSKDVWSYSPELVRQIIEADRAQRGETVAWIWRFSDGELHKTPFGTLAECERDAIGYDGSAVPLYTAPQPSQPAHTEAEVQELMEFAKHHALGTFSDTTIEDKFRRVLGVPKP